MTSSQAYIKHIFSDKLIFEKEVLHVKCDEDRKEVMTLVCSDICADIQLASQVNFLKIKSIDDLDFEKVKITLVQILLGELLSLLKEKRYTKVEIDNIKKDKRNQKFIYELASIYLRRFSNLFYKEVVNSFFDLIGTANKAENLSPVVLEVIHGSENRKTLLEQHGSGQILYKPEQAWMRVKQAKDDKNRQVQVYQIEIVKLVRRVDELKLKISAIVAARALSVEDLNKVTPKLLLDMFTEEDDIQLHTKKTMFSYVPAGELANILVRVASKALIVSKIPSEKNDYKQISEFFKRCSKTNTEKYLLERFEEYKAELVLKSATYRDKRLKLQTLRQRPLDSFDATLKKVKEAMVYNLQHL